ncbi:Type IV inositol polyphosphate 5-phosphatase 9, partial [Mucuna pruriens]
MPGKAEFMWPALVANKILNKRLGSSNFIADFPSNTEPLLGHDHSSLSSKTILNDHEDTQKYKIFVSTWNVGGIAPYEGLNMEDLLETCNKSYDIYVLGFQEIVPLKASNVLGYENSEICSKWNSIIREALNKRPGQQCEAPQDFQCIISKQMVGILISVWAKRQLRPFIRHPSVSCVGCGIIGCLGNKGSVSARFVLHETSLCFVCGHLASGGRERDEKHRNSNVAEIFSRTRFPKGPMLDLPRKILDHEFLSQQIMKTRISLPEETTHLLVQNGDWDSLLEYDQDGMKEQSNLPQPTSIVQIQTCTMDVVITGKKQPRGEHQHGVTELYGLKQIQYTRSESKLSDHRPVKALFIAQVRVLTALKSFQNLFLSERFEQIKTHFEVSHNDDFVCRKQSISRPKTTQVKQENQKEIKILLASVTYSEDLQVIPIVKYSALSLFADRFFPSLPNFIQLGISSSCLLRPVTHTTLQLFVLISLWISTKLHNSQPLSVSSFKSLAHSSIKEHHFTTRNFLDAEVLFLQVLNFEIGTTNIAFLFLEDLWIQFMGVAKVGELISIEACMEIMDLLYEKEDMSFLFRSPHSLAASILVYSPVVPKFRVVSYVITVPKQKWEFPVLAWVNFVTSCKEEDIIKMVTQILKH